MDMTIEPTDPQIPLRQLLGVRSEASRRPLAPSGIT